MIAYYAPNKQNENELAKFLDLRGTWAVRDYTMGMRNYSGVKVMQIIEKLKEVDAKSKGIDNPFTSAGELMRELIFSSSIRLLSGSKNPSMGEGGREADFTPPSSCRRNEMI